MDIIKMIASGIGLLIFFYLLVANGDSFAKVLSSGGNVLVGETKTLQARA